ncbi:MAG: tetratricopeptide repeat protein [Bacteroidales bacterium]|nr:tetratricopeptide repeat protein [Bacteroidales bacterium]
METLKRITLTILLTIFFGYIMAQNAATTQATFVKSYESEKSGNYVAAINTMKTIYKADSYIANIRLGWLCYLAKQYTESIKYYEKSIGLKPYAIEARFGCVKPLSAIESWDKVKANYVEILKIDPQNTIANYWLGVIYYNRKDFANATKLFEKVVNLYPLDYDSVIMLAWSKLSIGKSADARVLFNHALILRPNDSSALSGLKLIK